ncbi:MAG: putative amidase [Burkholderia sp.]|nr:putative amidase [Burkholderia sp.]
MLNEFPSAIALRNAVIARKISAVEVVRQSLERQQRLEPQLNCFSTCTPEMAMAAAKRADQALMRGEAPGALHGLPISVKDLIAVGGVRQTFGSRSMEDNIAQIDAPAVARVKAAGACIVGITTTSEFGCKAVGDSPLTGITRNPWNTAKTPGGSSCGAAASVAAGVTPFALGTDGGGSIREPSSLTGLFGIKAQFARVPVFPAAATPTLAHIGPLTRTVRDAAMLLSVIAGHDARDPFSVAADVPDFLGACDLPVKGMRLAWSPTLGYARPDAEIVRITESAVKRFEALGCEIINLEEGIGTDPAELWMAEFYAGVGTRLNDTLRNCSELLDPAVALMLEKALDQSLLDYYSKVFARYQFREKIRKLFDSFDLLLTPTAPVAAFDVGVNVPPQFADRNVCSWQYYTYPFNLTGQPAASLPVGFTEGGLPVGLQLVAGINCETDIFRAAASFEAAYPWAGVKPPGT